MMTQNMGMGGMNNMNQMGMNNMSNQMGNQNMMGIGGMNNMAGNQMMNQNMGMNMNPMMPNMMGQTNMMNNPAMMQMMVNQMNLQNQMNDILNNKSQNMGSQSQNQSSSQSQSYSNPSGGKSIIFRKSGEGEQGAPIMVQCLDSDKVSEVIKRYRAKSGDQDPSKKFIFNAKALNLDLTVAEAGLTDNANIFVVTTRGVKGAL